MKNEELSMVGDSMLKLKARESRIKEGDKNTKFFNRSIARRRGKNEIKMIR